MNIEELKYINQKALMMELVELTKGCVLAWSKVGEGVYYSKIGTNATYEFFVSTSRDDIFSTSRSGRNYSLDIKKNGKYYKSYNSVVDYGVEQIYREVELYSIDGLLRKRRKLANFVADLIDCRHIFYEFPSGGILASGQNILTTIGLNFGGVVSGGTAGVEKVNPFAQFGVICGGLATVNEINFALLFDASSWNSVPEPYRSYLNSSKNRWETYIKYDTNAVNEIKTLLPAWNGLRLNSYNQINSSSSTTIASCGVFQYVDLETATSSVKFNSISFNLTVNDYYRNFFSPADWVNIITHELGHALGIGIFWNSFFSSSGSIPPSNDFLNGLAYSNAQSAYNSIVSLSRTKIPLEASGGSGTSSAHWENNYRTAGSAGAGGLDHYGIMDELMIGFYAAGMNLKISNLSIKCLVDFGYEEISPGNSEGTVSVDNGMSFTKLNNLQKLNCECEKNKAIKIGTIRLKA